MSATGPYLSRY